MIRQCTWGLAWVGRCKSQAVDGSFFCAEHQKTCISCGDPATHECEETGQFVCGFHLCNLCEHTIFPDGTNGGVGFNQQPLPEGMKRHCRKTDQRYKPWYAREQET